MESAKPAYKRIVLKLSGEALRETGARDTISPHIVKEVARQVKEVYDLGIDTFVGTSQRVFPKEMKAAPLLRAWLHRLRGSGARIHARHRWTGWTDDGELRFATPSGEQIVHADMQSVVLFAFHRNQHEFAAAI